MESGTKPTTNEVSTDLMPQYHRAHIPGGTYFFTVVTFNRQPLFKEESAVLWLKQCLEAEVERHPFTIRAMVVLPDHLHTIWTLPEDDSDYSMRWRQIKSNFSRHYDRSTNGDVPESRRRKQEQDIWQRRFWEHAIKDQEDFNRHCDYIHFNPVKHGLVKSAAGWKASTFQRFVELGVYESDWGGRPDRTLLAMDCE